MRFKISTLLLMVLLVGALVTQAGSTPPTDDKISPSADRGLYVYKAYCVACHGVSGRGDGPMAARLYRDFGVRAVDLTQPSFHKKRSDAQLKEIVRAGGQAVHRTQFMPAWGNTLTNRQVGDLIAYIRELEEQPNLDSASMIPVEDKLELGRVLYSTYCLVCHGAQGRGDGPFIEGLKASGDAHKIPANFTAPDFFLHKTDAELIELVRSGAIHSGYGVPESAWWKKQMGDREVKALILYLRSLPMMPDPNRGKV